jgi:hypothetical protein
MSSGDGAKAGGEDSKSKSFQALRNLRWTEVLLLIGRPLE